MPFLNRTVVTSRLEFVSFARKEGAIPYNSNNSGTLAFIHACSDFTSSLVALG